MPSNLLTPRSIAVIGASTQPGKVGHDIFKNLVSQGFSGSVYPINVKGGELLGKKIYASIAELPETPDVAVIVIPAVAVPQALRDCSAKGTKTVIVISAGFGEVHTDDGAKLEQELADIARGEGLTVLGPNCLGFLRPSLKMNASFAKDLPNAGSIALISQSGATAVGLLDQSTERGLGFSFVASIGNKTVLDETDLLQMAIDDPETSVIGFYLESIKRPRAFMELAQSAATTKPIVLLKAGVSDQGAKAAASHTGALAGADAGIEALCRQAGIRRARTSDELFDLLAILSTQPLLPTNHIAVITNAGGPGILATDAASRAGLSLPALSARVSEPLKAALPPAASIGNPIDVLGDAQDDRYAAALSAAVSDPTIDGVVVIATPQVMTPVAAIAKRIAETAHTAPLLPIAACFMGGSSMDDGRAILRAAGIPYFDSPERAVNAMAALRRLPGTMTPAPAIDTARAAKAEAIIGDSDGLLPEDIAQKLLSLYRLPFASADIATSADDAVSIAARIGYPVIAKIASKDILHKTDIGGVALHLQTERDVREAYDRILANVHTHAPTAQIDGILIQRFVPAGNELIAGIVRDPSVGPLIMVGLGGIYTELFRDTSFRLAPVTQTEAYDMLQELTSWKLLLGLRGAAQRNIDALAVAVSALSQMAAELPAIDSIDINPLLVDETGITVADAKVVIRRV